MDDEELLEFAAKAMWNGKEASFRFDEKESAILYLDADNQDHNGQDREFVWNPLQSNHDALWLAVTLNLHIAIDANSSGCITVSWDFDEGGNARREVVEETCEAEYDCIATRRAITRAAAEIGETMS